MKTVKFIKVWLAVSSVSLLILAGCSDGGSSSSGNNSTAKGSSVTVTTVLTTQ